MASLSQRAVSPDPPAGSAFPAATIRDALERILASGPFLNARRPSQFLRFIVERTLAGEDDRIKEYVIGVEVFGRPETYDPKDDPVVRIEAGRLRKKLADYYSGPGQNDSLIVDLPKGGYVPVFQRRLPGNKREVSKAEAAQPSEAARYWIPGAAAVLVVLAAVALAGAHYLHSWPHTAAGAPTSIAVLPFRDLSGDTAREYLSAGVTEELTTGLAQLNGLRVVAATSARKFQGKSEDVRKIGQDLNAEAVLEGSITQAGKGLRINAQLIDTRNGYHLWSKAYDVQPADLLASENDIVEETARALRISVPAGVRPAKRDTENSEAHDLYLHGRYLWNTRQLPDMLESARLFERAIKDDPKYALAYAGLADTYTVMAVNSQMSPAEALPKAKAALQRALELDPSLARAHATLGLLKSQCEWDWHGAEQEFHKAVDLEPNYAPAHHWAGLNYMDIGQFAAADAEFRQAQILDPLSPMISEARAENFCYARRFDDAISAVLNMPDPRVGWIVLAYSYIFKGRYEEALRIPSVASPKDMNGFIIRAAALARSGDRAGGMKILHDLERNQRNAGAAHDYIPPGVLAWAYAMMGEKERAFALLEKAYQQRDPALANLKVDPGFDSLRSDARYTALLGKVGLSD